MQLHQNLNRLKELDIEVLIIGPENSYAFKKYWERKSLSFTGLPDPDHSVLNFYGQEVKIFKFGRMPAQMLVDKFGILKFVHYSSSMADIPDLDVIEKMIINN